MTDAEEALAERLAIRVVDGPMTPEAAAAAEGVPCPAWLRASPGGPAAAPGTIGQPRPR